MKTITPPPDLPINWDDCTVEQLRWLAAYGSYGQRPIAERHLKMLVRDHKTEREAMTGMTEYEMARLASQGISPID